ncbi:hypothetical protein [Pseudonocardia nigra]|uniref:hypothetical protein n=1 Tax=Pseudonocardia nigra TaxID=1921578 RepID=UPI0027E30759|nr:hypothetical protein [Pseudonocardia nigra]
MRHIATFCGQCNCGCPELFIDDAAPDDKRVVITDDFGQRIHMSLGQLADLVADVRKGMLDDLLGEGLTTPVLGVRPGAQRSAIRPPAVGENPQRPR